MKVNIYSGEDQGHSSHEWLRTRTPPPHLPSPPKKKNVERVRFQTSVRRRLIFL